MAKKKRSRRTAFVPTVVFSTAVLGVIPACAVGCGGQSSTGGGGSDATADRQLLGVAAVGYCAFCDGGTFNVAAIGYDSGLDAGLDAGSDAGGDAGDASDATGPTCPPVCAVAFMGFDAGMDSSDKG